MVIIIKKDLFFGYTHIISDVGKDGGFYIIAFGSPFIASAQDGCSFFLSRIYQFQNFVELLLADLAIENKNVTQ